MLKDRTLLVMCLGEISVAPYPCPGSSAEAMQQLRPLPLFSIIQWPLIGFIVRWVSSALLTKMLQHIRIYRVTHLR